jgi:signal transduction histidine kinase
MLYWLKIVSILALLKDKFLPIFLYLMKPLLALYKRIEVKLSPYFVIYYRFFNVNRDNYPEITSYRDAVVSLNFISVYAAAWTSYLPVYFGFAFNLFAGLAVLCIGLSTSLVGLLVIKYQLNPKRAILVATAGGGLNLVAIAAATGGVWSPIYGWLYVAGIPLYILYSGYAGFALSSVLAVLSGMLCVFYGVGWGFPFPLHGVGHQYFNAFTYSASQFTSGMLGYIFRNKVDTAMAESEKLRKEAQLKDQKTQTIFNAIKGSVLTFGADFRIIQTNPKAQATLKNIDGLSLLKSIKLDNQKEAEMFGALDMIMLGDELNFEVNEDHLPLKCRINGRRHELQWSPILENSTVTEMLLVLIDKEDELKKDEEAEKEKEKIVYVGKLLNINPGRRLEFIEKTKEAFERSIELINKNELMKAGRILHTMKATVRGFKFETLAALVHKTETELNLNLKSANSLLSECLKEVEKIIEAAKFAEIYKSDSIIISKSDALEAIKNKKESELLLNLTVTTLESLLVSFEKLLINHSEARGMKTPKMDVSSTAISIKNEVCDMLQGAFGHILGNALDHSIECEEERKAKGKSPQGLITIKARSDEERVYIRVSDDGRGLAIDKIREKALAKGLIPENTDISNPNDIAELIFHPNFSTKETVSATAGRGVGMDAVRSTIEELGGKCYAEVYSDSYAPFAPWELVIVLPNSIKEELTKEKSS